MRLLVALGLVTLALFLYWLSDQQYAGYKPLYYLLLISIGYRILKVLFEWYHYWAIRQPAPPPSVTRKWTVDMLTTAMPGEPYELIKDTLEAMVAVRYPHTTYLCDEGNDPQLRALCNSLGVRHVTRTVKVNAKAGNINNALRTATGEICVVLDPDHRPVPQMLDEVLPYFEDKNIGFVQSVQAYKNAGDSVVARGAAEQTYTFYGPMMMGMSHYGTAQAIGANCVFRRAALDSIGGHAAGLSEDMHTAMQLHAKGWQSVYLPKILTRGLVPSNMGAYYKQQLKWSRGTFELLFMVLPGLFRKLTWRQKIHYSLIPLHFAAGLVALVDILIPLLALVTGEVPLLLEFSKAYLCLMPFLVMIILVRQYAQRWLLEKRERGFHLRGGILLFGAWWVLLVGLVYTFFRIKVPYIPTPKEDRVENNFWLCLPNLVAVGLSAVVVAIGLRYDSNPYSWLMAGYAAFNALLLLLAVWMGQDRWRHQLQVRAAGLAPLRNMGVRAVRATEWVANGIYSLLRQQAPQLALGTMILLGLMGWKALHPVEQAEVPKDRNIGGFYLGVHLNSALNNRTPAGEVEAAGIGPANVVVLQDFWGGAGSRQVHQLVQQLVQQGRLPLINWLPAHRNGAPLVQGKGIMTAIANGQCDKYLLQYALWIRSLKAPVMISFAPESDNPAMPWHITRQNPLADYRDAFRHVCTLFQQSGVNNISWMWNVWQPGNMRVMYPGDIYVDWVGVSSTSLFGSKSFKQAFRPFHLQMKAIPRPVMLTRFQGKPDAALAQIQQVLETREQVYPEINGLVLDDQKSTDDLHFAAAGSSPEAVFLEKVQSLLPDLATFPCDNNKEENLAAANSRNIKGRSGTFSLMQDGRPFYIRGIAYNPEQSWRDGYHPLNRKKLDADFAAIRKMGANTIRRYAPSLNDRGILEAAGRHNLQVMYGFWFDPKVDYAKDKKQVAAYIREVEATVRRYKDEKAVLMWGVGNESSGLLKHHFAQPYLTVVRRAYMDMVETIARRVHAIDPQRPVFTSLEHARQLPGEIHDFGTEAPSVDVIAINSYYKQWISSVHDLVHRMSPGKPYLISEFGNKGYWESHLTDQDPHKRLVELSDRNKALLFASEWSEDVAAHAGCNVGGVAFCWQDRYEGTATWFGITDYKGRKKQAYYSLQQAWNGKPVVVNEDLFLVGPSFTLKPGGTYEFTAVYKSKETPALEWQLLAEDYLSTDVAIAPGALSNKVQITLPVKGHRYRLYVYATYKDGKVVTASWPLTIYDGVFNESI